MYLYLYNNIYFVSSPWRVWYIFFSNYQTPFILCCSLSDFPLSWCFCLFSFLLPSLVIWFIWFTSVNFHLCFVFLSILHLTPLLPPAVWCCVVVVVLGVVRVILDPSCIAPGPSLSMWPMPFDLCGPTLCTLPVTFGHLLMSVWCLGDDTFDHLHTSHTLAPHSRTTTMLSPTRGSSHFSLQLPITAQSAGSKGGEGNSSCSQ